MTAEQARAVLVDDVQERRVRLMEWLRAAGVAVVAEVPLGVSAAPAAASAQPEYVFIAFEEPLPRAMKAVEVLAATAPSRHRGLLGRGYQCGVSAGSPGGSALLAR